MIFFTNIKKYSIILVLFSLISCNKTNWHENFIEKNKNPFGTYIIFNETKELFKNKEVHYLKENIYDYLFYNVKDTDFGNYICIKSSAYKLKADGLDYLLSSVNKGSNAFFSLNTFPKHFQDSLKFTINNIDKTVFAPEELKKLSGKLNLENKDLKKQSFQFDRNIRKSYFETYNKNNTIVLGTMEIEGKNQPNFIKIYYGKGTIYLHTNPVVFTNYYLLNGNEAYTENVLSYLPVENILWDPQIKSSTFKYKNDSPKEDSIFKFFLQHPTLKWFLFVSFISLLLFMLFNARRKQRAIPVIKPLQNSTIEFAQTIANLYLKEEDHKNLVDKKTTYFLEKIREKYLIDTNNLNVQFIEKLALKSNNDLSSTKYLINTIIALNSKTECTETELLVLNKMIEKFLKK